GGGGRAPDAPAQRRPGAAGRGGRERPPRGRDRVRGDPPPRGRRRTPRGGGLRVGLVRTHRPDRSTGDGAGDLRAHGGPPRAGGRRFCFLHTDLANPTSNAIYVRIGYRRVCDSVVLAFEAA